MTIQHIDNQIIITLPASVDIAGVQRLVNYLLYREATQHSQATQGSVDELARNVNQQWWKENKQRFLPE
ncbi:MAG: hypothetical protein NW241_08925 [Bacteroidia bacterium]|nr:hypothetical protein [Bacteroidia bacterium]